MLSYLLWRYVKQKGSVVSVAFDLREYQDFLKAFLLVYDDSSIPVINSAIEKREKHILHQVGSSPVL